MSGPFATVRQTVSENRARFDRRSTRSLKSPVSNIYLGVLKTAEVPFHKLLAVCRGESDGEAISARLRTVGDSSRAKITVRIAARPPPASPPAREQTLCCLSAGPPGFSRDKVTGARWQLMCCQKCGAATCYWGYSTPRRLHPRLFFNFFFIHLSVRDESPQVLVSKSPLQTLTNLGCRMQMGRVPERRLANGITSCQSHW